MVSFLIIPSIVLLFLLFIIPIRRFQSKTRPLPPGPPGLPIIGNLHQLDTSDLSDYLWRLSKRYGPLMSLRLGHVQTLVVSSAEMAKEIMKTNDLVFCTRPALTGQKKLSYDNKDIALSPYNEYWRQMRKICTLHLFSMKQVNSFRSVREEEVFDMIDRIKTQSSMKQVVNLSDDAMVLTSNIICRVGFGKRPSAYNNRKDGTRMFELMSEFQEVLTNFYYRDHFPLLGWLDELNGSIARLEKLFKDLDEFYQEVIDEHLNQNQQNKIQDDMVDILLKLKQDYANDLTFDHVKGILMEIDSVSRNFLQETFINLLDHLARNNRNSFHPSFHIKLLILFLKDILSGGTETSASTVVWTMTLLIKNPDSLNKAQQEVRNAVGKKGKVDEEDLDKLEYLKAVIKEALRLYPVLPLLIPRESRERCVLEGYEIPKKTLVYVNVWAVGRDPKCWERPEEFEPERFMGSSVEYKGADFEWIPFGSGRRGCPGLLLGATTVELALSNLLYSFDWGLPEGTKDIDTLKSEGTVAHKKIALQLVAKVPDIIDYKSSRHLNEAM
ncbi:putative cytochrome P450 [Helianthus annuus]|nr:putative cytochrome P450 [Helianthus annuus]